MGYLHRLTLERMCRDMNYIYLALYCVLAMRGCSSYILATVMVARYGKESPF